MTFNRDHPGLEDFRVKWEKLDYSWVETEQKTKLEQQDRKYPVPSNTTSMSTEVVAWYPFSSLLYYMYYTTVYRAVQYRYIVLYESVAL